MVQMTEGSSIRAPAGKPIDPELRQLDDSIRTTRCRSGSQGKTYANVCPVNLEAGFREGYELGRLHHEKKREISSRESRIRSLENSIREDEKLLAAGTDDRRAVERRIDDNRRTIRDLDRDIGRMESDLRRIEDDMEDFRYRAAPLSQG
jgi:chromosome segregation ATPase